MGTYYSWQAVAHVCVKQLREHKVMHVANKLYCAKQVYFRRVFVIVGWDSFIGKRLATGLMVRGSNPGGGVA